MTSVEFWKGAGGEGESKTVQITARLLIVRQQASRAIAGRLTSGPPSLNARPE
jgi:hypothetical protein